MNIKTSVTIISTNLNKRILDKYRDYHIINDNFTYQELLNYKKVIFFNVLNNLKKDELDKLFQYLSAEKEVTLIFKRNYPLTYFQYRNQLN